MTLLRPAAGLVMGIATIWFLLIYIYILRSHWIVGAAYVGLLGDWSFSLHNTPPLEVLQALVGIGLCFLLGWWIQVGAQFEAGRVEKFAAAFLVGLGVSGIAFELLTMAHGLRTVLAWLLWLVLLGGAWWLKQNGSVLRWAREPLFEFPTEPPVEYSFFPQRVDRILWWIFLVPVLILSGLTFWHALFFPETNWDSLILYLGYSRMTFLQHAFPFKAEVQVGIGLGANYPHLYPNFGAIGSTLFGSWSDMHQRLAAPICGVLASLLLFFTARGLFGSGLLAIAAVLAFRATPHTMTYTTYASDYAVAILFAAQFFHFARVFLHSPTRGHLALLTLMPAAAMHLNFLMGLFWIPWGFVVGWCVIREDGWRRLATAAFSRRVIIWIFFAGVALASPWHVRNWALTGNPVYAFFPEIFTSSVRINLDVLRSAELEWYRVGDGVSKTAEFYHDLRTGERRDEASTDFRRQATLADRLHASFLYWVGFDIIDARPNGGFDVGRWSSRIRHLLRVTRNEVGGDHQLSDTQSLLRFNHAWKLTPLVPGLILPAVLVFAAVLVAFFRRWVAIHPATIATLSAASILLCGLFAYKYLLADFYSYQIIPFLGPGTLLVALLLWAAARVSRMLLGLLLMGIFAMAWMPGLPFALMGPKFFGVRTVAGQTFSATKLDHFRHPGMHPALFMRLAYGDDPDMWDHVNGTIPGRRLLTHENRHYVFDPSITLIHLDDWDIQSLYGLDNPAEIANALLSRDIEHYLYIENEDRHVINQRLKMPLLLEAGHLEEQFRAGRNILYRIVSEPRRN